MVRRPRVFLNGILLKLLMSSQHAFTNSQFVASKIQNSHISLLHTQKSLCFCKLSSRTASKKSIPRLSSQGFSSESLACIHTTENPTYPRTKLSALKMKLEMLGFNPEDVSPGQKNGLLCPSCKGGESEEKSMSLFVSKDGNTALYNCFRAKCGYGASTQVVVDSKQLYEIRESYQKEEMREIREEDLQLEPLQQELLGYFAVRMISKETLQRNFVMQKKTYSRGTAIAFTYRRDGVLVGCKYRDADKGFWKEKDAEKIFYGLDDVKQTSDIIIVEGEIDKLSMEEAGFRNCVSVPDGAPRSVRPGELPPVEQDVKYDYLRSCEKYLEKASRIILATDGDQPGQALATELARRVGRERCWIVKWPKKNDVEIFKDANEVLTYLGPEVLRKLVEDAELYPIRGLFRFQNFFHEIDAYYHQLLAFELGVSTGWRDVDNLYNVVPGELTIVSGVPNSGKSEWIDALLCNINKNSGWRFALCSMENTVHEHARKLLEKHIRKPFFNARYGESAERMTSEELDEGKKWLDDTFHLVRSEKDSFPNVKWVLDLAKAAVLRYGVNGLVIDPYNELDHQRPQSQTETEYVSQILTLVKRFARHYSCHVWFVAHPRQLHNWLGDPPNLYDISGSAHFMNKCDNGIVIHRNRDPAAGPLDRVQVCVLKVRNKVAGTIGDAYLSYNRATGEFMDIETAP